MFSTDYPASQPHTTHGLTTPRTGESPPRAPLEARPGNTASVGACGLRAPRPGPRASGSAVARAAVLGGRAHRPPAEHTPMAMHTFTPLDRRVRHTGTRSFSRRTQYQVSMSIRISAPLSLKSGYEDRV